MGPADWNYMELEHPPYAHSEPLSNVTKLWLDIETVTNLLPVATDSGFIWFHAPPELKASLMPSVAVSVVDNPHTFPEETGTQTATHLKTPSFFQHMDKLLLP